MDRLVFVFFGGYSFKEADIFAFRWVNSVLQDWACYAFLISRLTLFSFYICLHCKAEKLKYSD